MVSPRFLFAMRMLSAASVCWLLTTTSLAQEVRDVTCGGDRTKCELDMLTSCPAGATLVSEQIAGQPAPPPVAAPEAPAAEAPLMAPSSRAAEVPQASTSTLELVYKLSYHCGAPVSPDLSRAAAQQVESQRAQLHLDWLRRREEDRRSHRLGPPITVLVTGLIVAALPIPLLVQEGLEAAPLGLFVSGVLGTGLASAGAIWLSRVVRKRRAIGEEIRVYGLATPARFALDARPHSVSAQVAFRF